MCMLQAKKISNKVVPYRSLAVGLMHTAGPCALEALYYGAVHGESKKDRTSKLFDMLWKELKIIIGIRKEQKLFIFGNRSRKLLANLVNGSKEVEHIMALKWWEAVKVPSPDGYTGEFFKVMKEEIENIMPEIFNSNGSTVMGNLYQWAIWLILEINVYILYSVLFTLQCK